MAEKNPYSYYLEIASNMPGLSAKEKEAEAKRQYQLDPNSTYKGKRPTASSVSPGSTFDPKIPTTSTKNPLTPVKTGKRTDWEAFINGGIIYVPSTTTGGVTTEAYIQLPQTDTQQKPVQVILLPSSDGLGYQTLDVTTAVKDFLRTFPKNDSSYMFLKTQLQQYYKGGVNGQDYKRSLTQPINETDTGLLEAVKNALNAMSLNNYQGSLDYASLSQIERSKFSPNLFDYGSFVRSRQIQPAKESQSSRVSSLTTKMDSDAEFNRTVQQYIGDPLLVDKVNVLREAYWQKLHAEELRRISVSTSISDPITGITSSQGTGYAPLTEQDRIEMRLKFIIDGDKKSNSVGIKNATQEQLENTGALVGAAYGKLKEIASDYGIRLTHTELLTRVNRSLKPGGPTAGVSATSLSTGLEAEANSIKQASKAYFKGLSSYIDQGLKVSDISSNFQRLKEQEMGLTDNAIDIFDTDVQKAISGTDISSVNDFILGVRSNPAWRKTPKANEMAATFINTLLRTFGKTG